MITRKAMIASESPRNRDASDQQVVASCWRWNGLGLFASKRAVCLSLRRREIFRRISA